MVKSKADKWRRYMQGRDMMYRTVIPAFENLSLPEADILKKCGQFINVVECKACHLQHFAGFKRCKSRWCIPCNHVKVLAWIARLILVMEDWMECGGKISMLNFTVKDMDKLSDGIELLNKSFRSFYHTPRRRERWKRRFPGGVRSLEVKIGKYSGKWHPHMHCLALQPPDYQKDYDWLKEDWENITKKQYKKIIGGDFEKVGSVWIKNVTGDNLLNAICETLKYILKPENSLYEDEDILWEAWYTLKGKRQINTWGLLRGLSKKVDEDIEQKDEKILTEFICQRCGCTSGELKAMLFSTISDDSLFFDLK